jgi:hypothetical protein
MGSVTCAAGNAGTLSLEVRFWAAAEYMHVLRAAAPAAVDANTWSLAEVPEVLGAASGAHMPGVGVLVERLVEDSLAKQAALEHVQRAADAAEARCEVAGWRVKDLDGRNRALAGDVDALRKLLHDGQAAAQATADADALARLSPEQLLRRCGAYAASAQHERARCCELLKRLKVCAPQGLTCLHF